MAARRRSNNNSNKLVDTTDVGAMPPAPLSLTHLVRQRGRGRGRALPPAGSVVSDNAAYLTVEATAIVSASPADTFHSLFEEAPVYRCAPALPATAAQSTTTTTTTTTATVSTVATASLLATPALVKSSGKGAVAAAGAATVLDSVVTPKFAVSTSATVVFPPLPSPYVLSHQSWTVSRAAASPCVVVDALADAFRALSIDATFLAMSAEFRCAATVEFRALRFAARLFDADGTCVEFQLNSGGSMEYHQLYANIVNALPEHIAAGCSIVNKTRGGNSNSKPLSFTPPPLDGCAPVSTLSAGDVAPLVRMATCGMRTMQRDATAALLEFSTLADNAAVLVNDGVLTAMGTVIATCQDWVAVQAAVSVIANVLSFVFTAATAAAAAVVDSAVKASCTTVVNMLAEVRQRAQGTLCSDEAAQQALRRECCRALAFMTLNDRMVSEVQAAGGRKVLSTATHAQDVREKAFAMSAMSRLVIPPTCA